MRPDDWQTQFGMQLTALVEDELAKHCKSLEGEISHDRSQLLRGRIKALRWLLALKDESSND